MKATLWIVFLILTAALLAWTTANNENFKKFNAVCVLHNLLRQPIPEHKVDSSDITGGDQAPATKASDIMETIMTQITKINLTAAEAAIAEILGDTTDNGSWAKVSTDNNKKGYFTKMDEQSFGQMKATYKEITTGAGGRNFRDEYALPLKDSAKKVLRPAIARLAAEAVQINDKLTSVSNQPLILAQEPRTAALTVNYEAKCAATHAGALKTFDLWTARPDSSNFPWANNQAPSGACNPTAPSADMPGATLIADIVCLCGGDATNTHTGCTNGITSTALAGGSEQAKASSNWQALKSACEAVKPTAAIKLSSSSLQTALATVFNFLGKNVLKAGNRETSAATAPRVTAGSLGVHVPSQYGPPQCGSSDGSNSYAAQSQGLCMDYGELLATKNGIPWAEQVQIVMQKLHQIREEYRYSISLLYKAETTKNQMRSLLLLIPAMAQHQEQPNNNQRSQTQPTVEEQNKCAKFNNNETHCPTDSCEYDKSKNECKAKTAAGTGETPKEATTATGCAKHGSKAECDADKAGDNQNCAWRKGKTGEDESEKNLPLFQFTYN